MYDEAGLEAESVRWNVSAAKKDEKDKVGEEEEEDVT